MTITMLDINDTSKCTGLSSSVLRVWEQRHGWPLPDRGRNGYRSYRPQLVADLQRAAGWVKAGTPIRKLIVDGLPRWPSTERVVTPVLAEARALAPPPGRAEAQLRRELLDAFAGLRAPTVRHLIERIFWTVRPRDEVSTALAPALVALAELQRDLRPLLEEDAILGLVRSRCDALIRMQPTTADALLIVPARPSDTALASLVAIALTYRGVPARRWEQTGQPPSACVVVTSEGRSSWRRHQLAELSLLECGDGPSIADLIDVARPMAWLTSPIA